MWQLENSEIDYLYSLQQSKDIFESIIERTYSAMVHQGDCVVDGGAAHGLHTKPMAKLVGPQGRVLAFEPVPSMFAELKKAMAQTPQVVVSDSAVGDQDGTVDFHHVKNKPTYSSLRPRTNYPFDPQIEILQVPQITLDQFIARQALPASMRVRICKLDLGGAEFLAVRGAKETMRKHRCIVIFESTRAEAAIRYGYTQKDFFSLFSDVGYRLFDIFGRPYEPAHFSLPFKTSKIPWYQIAVPAEASEMVTFTRRAIATLLAARRGSSSAFLSGPSFG